MQYNMDLSRFSIRNYKELLKTQNLLSGRKILLQDIDQNFQAIENSGIRDVASLKKALSTPKKVASFAEACALPEDYIVILKRELGSLEQKPVPLSDFPGVDSLQIKRLYEAGIKNSKEYFESNPTERDELLCLCDLVRINGVGAIAARAFYEAGYKSVSDVANANTAAMLQSVSDVNREKQYYHAKLGTKDMQFCIDFALVIMKFSEEGGEE